MGLLFGDTYVTNKTYNTTSEGMVRATKELAQATYKVAESNQNIANAIREDKVTISHERYAELINKRKALESIKQEISIRIGALCSVVNSKFYNERYINTYFMNAHSIDIFREGLKEGYCVGLNNKDKEAYFCKLNPEKEVRYFDYKTIEDLGYEVVMFKNPLYVKETEGDAKIAGKEYHSLLREEDLLDNTYIPAANILPKFMFELLNVNRDMGNTDNNYKFRSFVNHFFNEASPMWKYHHGSGSYLFISNGFIWEYEYGKAIIIKKITT